MQKLNKTHREALKLMLEGQLTMDAIAEHVKKSRRTLYNWKSDPIFAAEYEELQRQQQNVIRAKIARNAGYAADRARKILIESEDDKAAATVIADALDRAGFPKLKASDVAHGENKTEAGIVYIPRKLAEETDGDA